MCIAQSLIHAHIRIHTQRKKNKAKYSEDSKGHPYPIKQQCTNQVFRVLVLANSPTAGLVHPQKAALCLSDKSVRTNICKSSIVVGISL